MNDRREVREYRSSELASMLLEQLKPETRAMLDMLDCRIDACGSYVDITGGDVWLLDMGPSMLDPYGSIEKWAQRAAGFIDEWAVRGCEPVRLRWSGPEKTDVKWLPMGDPSLDF